MGAATRGVALALFIASAPRAGQDKCGPEELVPWWPRASGGSREFTTAEKAIMDANLKAAEEIVRKTNYGSPRGFAVRPWWGYSGPMRDQRGWGHISPPPATINRRRLPHHVR